MTFLILALITVAGTAAAMTLRSAVHCVLALTVGLAGLAGLFLQLDAQFVGLTQLLVYVGAVAILAVFAIMMTQSARANAHPAISSTWLAGAVIAAAVFALLAHTIRTGLIPTTAPPPLPTVTVQQIGDALIHRFVLPLEIIGILLTAALIGAVVLALPDSPAPETSQQDTPQ
jgi:NADH-quinone oxidoreductase subunit J